MWLFPVFHTTADEKQSIDRRTNLQVYAVYYFGDQNGWNTDGGMAPISYEVIEKEHLQHRQDDPGRDLGTTWGSAKAQAVFSHFITIPFLQSPGPLFKGNNIEVKLGGDVSPVSVNAVAQLKLTPIAFLNLAVGAKLGTGWSFFGVFNGLGRNLPGKQYNGPLHEPFSGLVADFHASGTFQFDVAAVWPGKWHHIVTQLTPSIHWRGYTGAGPDTAWEYEADGGMNFNGFKFLGSYFLGYQMPIALNTVGVLVETEQYVGDVATKSPMNAGGWGSDFVEVTISPLASVTISEATSLSILLQFQNARDYTKETIGNRYFEYRSYTGTYFDLYRIAFVFGVEL
jgi:hypothetical protein